VRGLAVGLVVVGVLLSGCSEKQEASNTLPSQTSAAETSESLPTVGPADFPVPDEARTKDAAGAEAFLRYFVDLINHQRAIPAGQPLREIGPECQTCLRFARIYDEAADAGYRYEGGELSLEGLGTEMVDSRTALINFIASQDAVQRVDQAGAPVDAGQQATPRLTGGIRLGFSDSDQSWIVEGFDLG
jgi:hypothetical protein